MIKVKDCICPNCGNKKHMYRNASYDYWCENCGWQESTEEVDNELDSKERH